MVSREEILAAYSILTKHAVDSRYPEEIATASDAENAMRICGEVREAVRTALKLSHEGDSSN